MSTLNTNDQYDQQAAECRRLFTQKMKDYGTAWRVLRISSLIDQLYIKAARIRNIEENKLQKIDDPVDQEYIGIINYSLMSLIQLKLGATDDCKLTHAEILTHYDQQLTEAKDLMLAKNHDYGEVWRQMNRSSLTDLILMKVLRMKQIFQNNGETLVSEGIDANLKDMINYAIFALIKLSESNSLETI